MIGEGLGLCLREGRRCLVQLHGSTWQLVGATVISAEKILSVQGCGRSHRLQVPKAVTEEYTLDRSRASGSNKTDPQFMDLVVSGLSPSAFLASH